MWAKIIKLFRISKHFSENLKNLQQDAWWNERGVSDSSCLSKNFHSRCQDRHYFSYLLNIFLRIYKFFANSEQVSFYFCIFAPDYRLVAMMSAEADGVAGLVTT